MVHFKDEGAEEREDRQRCRTDGEALTDGRRRVADRVELVRDVANFLAKATHLRDTTRVVRDRTIRIDRHHDRRASKHADRAHRDTEETHTFRHDRVGDEADNSDDEERDDRRFHPDREALDDAGAGTRLSRLGDSRHRSPSRVVLGDQADNGAANGAGCKGVGHCLANT